MNALNRSRFVRILCNPGEGGGSDIFSEFGVSAPGGDASVTDQTNDQDQNDQNSDEQNQDQQHDDQSQNQDQQSDQNDQQQDGQQNDQQPDEVTTLRQQLNNMANILASHGITISDVEGQAQNDQQQQNQQQDQQQQQNNQQQTQTPQWGPVVEITDEEFADAVENKATFQKILTTVRDQAVERTVQSIPQLVVNMVKQQLYLQQLSQEFYKANEDLAGVRPFVGVVANEVAAKNPGWTPDKVMEETAVQVRQRLALRGQAQNQPQDKKQSPGLPQPGNRGRVVKPELKGMEKEIASMIAAAEADGR